MSALVVDLSSAGRLVLAVILAAAVLSKLASPEAAARTFRRLGASEARANAGSRILVVLELLAAGVLLVGPGLLAGATAILLFTGFVAVALLARAGDGDCGCFGTTPQPHNHRFAVLLRLAGVGTGVLILVAGEESEGWPSVRSVWLAAIVLSVFVLRLPAIRTASLNNDRPPALLDGAMPGQRRMPRRALLHRFLSLAVAAVGVGGAIPLARSFACTPCLAGAGASAFNSGPSAVSDPSTADGSPCKLACSERRVTADAKAGDDFDSNTLMAGTDDAQLTAVAAIYRTDLLRSATDFQRCAERC